MHGATEKETERLTHCPNDGMILLIIHSSGIYCLIHLVYKMYVKSQILQSQCLKAQRDVVK